MINIQLVKTLGMALVAICFGVYSVNAQAQENEAILPGEVWRDTDGNPIHAHGGGILYHEGIYYWYGEYKKGPTVLPEWATWECYRTEVTGVGCYSSRDLLNWKFEGIVLPAVKNNPGHDLHPSKVLERPKVVYNRKTGKFVMWAHVESADYSKACAGVAVSDSPTGEFRYLGSFRPNDAMSRDQTVFVDDDGRAYQFYSSEHNATMYISLLTDDYLKPSGRFVRRFVKESREAPAVFRHGGKYYMLSSGCTGWDPNKAEIAVADSILGEWTTIGNPCTGPEAEKTFYAQSTYVQPVIGKKNAYIAMFDRWNKKDLEDSRYVWLPVQIENGKITIPWHDKWTPDIFGEDASSIAATPDDVMSVLHRVNRHWQTTHPEHGRAFWDNAAYHTGNMEAFFLTKNPEYLKYSEAWAEHNEWKGAKSDDKANWKYSYGESDEYVLFGDYQACFQTYIDLYSVAPQEYKIARAREVMEYQMSTPEHDYWWWADGLYMAMPVMTKLYSITGNPLYPEKLHAYLAYADSLMYDSEAGLYYRDAKYVYPAHQTLNGKKDFWARGDGWVLAGLAKVLKDLPETDRYRREYIGRFRTLARSVAGCQQPEGYWTRSMLDPSHAPGAETSGTAFFTYGLLWGLNNGLLDAATYRPVVEKAWNYLTTVALQPDGRVGYVQPVGEKAIPGQVVDANSTSGFGVGAFLLAACEMYRFVNRRLF